MKQTSKAYLKARAQKVFREEFKNIIKDEFKKDQAKEVKKQKKIFKTKVKDKSALKKIFRW